MNALIRDRATAGREQAELERRMLRRAADEVACLATPEPFGAIGMWYGSFPQLTDEEVQRVLRERWAEEDSRRFGAAPASKVAAPA
jgi:putative phosphoribosyl transferase